MEDSLKYLIGLFLIRCIIGTKNTWGTISPYAISYFHSLDNTFSLTILSSVVGFAYVSEGLILLASSTIQKAIGTRFVLLIAIVCVSCAFLLSSFTTNPIVFVIVYSGLHGAGSGLTFMVIVWPGWKYFPDRKNLVFSISSIAYSLGLLWGLFISYMINPDNTKPQESNGVFVYPSEINDNFIMTLRIFSGICFAIGIVGVLVLKDPEADEIKITAETNLLDIVSKLNFWMITSIYFFGFQFRIFIVTSYQTLVLDKYSNQELSFIGSFAAVSQCFGNLTLGLAYDNFDQIIVSAIFSGLLLILSVGLYLFMMNIIIYGIYINLCWLVTVYISFSAVNLVNKVFPGSYKMGFSFVSFGYLLAGVFSIVIENFVLDHLNSIGVTVLFCTINGFALVLHFIISPRLPKYEKYNEL
jgi:MFS family permease